MNDGEPLLPGRRLRARVGHARVFHGSEGDFVLKHVAVEASAPATADRYEGLRREARVLDALNAGEDGAPSRLIWSTFDGRTGATLQPWTGERLRMENPRQALKMAQAVDDLHRAGYLHGDLQPAHFTADGEGDVHLIDFDVAVPVEGGSDYGGGMLHFMAPEVAEGMARRSRTIALTKRAEVCSFGAVLYYLITGRNLTPYPDGAGLWAYQGSASRTAALDLRFADEPTAPHQGVYGNPVQRESLHRAPTEFGTRSLRNPARALIPGWEGVEGARAVIDAQPIRQRYGAP
ncbi:protein kinase domain-containing protein [Salininema proteolyticum]|uniref:Protein kinase domain-containing protein n=1 Tax=Salininema proteolyticum TaxID=1607685 RepID=A0ABV8TXC5_9ACTN